MDITPELLVRLTNVLMYDLGESRENLELLLELKERRVLPADEVIDRLVRIHTLAAAKVKFIRAVMDSELLTVVTDCGIELLKFWEQQHPILAEGEADDT